MTQVYLWTPGKGRELFPLDAKEEFEKRRIKIGEGVTIRSGAIIRDGAYIAAGAYIGAEVTIEAVAIIGAGAHIGANQRPRCLHITGSKHPIYYWGEDVIKIGCIKKTIAEWRDEYNTVGIEEGYTPEQISEYRDHIETVAAFHEKYKMVEQKKEV